MIYWAPLFHFYQPPTQTFTVLKKVCEESYRPLIKVLQGYPYAKATINMNAVLTEMLWEHSQVGIIRGLQELAQRGQVEFTGSGKYHPILPLIPGEEMVRQIRRNHLTNHYFFGPVYAPRGFFPPEMAYSPDILAPVLESRHEWIILSGIACPAQWPMDIIYEVEADGERIAVFFRDDILSNKISFQSIDGSGFIQHLKQLHSGQGDIYVITAMDAETFGHHIQNWEMLFLAEVYEALEPAGPLFTTLPDQKPIAEQHQGLFNFGREAKNIQIVTISQLLDLFPRGPAIQPRTSSWSTSSDDIEHNNPFPLWNDKNNEVHQMQWEHTELCHDLVEKAEKLADNPQSQQFANIARGLLDPSLHSCQFWWASKKPWWDMNMVSRGLTQQMEAILNAFRAIRLSGCPEKEKKQAYYQVIVTRDLRLKIRDRLLWD